MRMKTELLYIRTGRKEAARTYEHEYYEYACNSF